MTKTVNIIRVRNPIQAALFNDYLRAQIIEAGGRWNGIKTKGHVEPFQTSKAVVAKEGEVLGLTFAAPKRNYNFNDSTYVNVAENLDKLTEIATKANKGTKVEKKELGFQLADLKEIFKNSPQPAPVAVAVVAADEKALAAAPTTPATPQVEEVQS